MHAFVKTSLLAAAALIALPALAQAPAGPPAGPGGPPHAFPTPGPVQVHQLTADIWWGEGAGGNVGFVVGDKGVIVIDTTVAEATGRQLLAAIAKVTPKPVTTVILTHGDIDHVAGLKAFPTGLTVIAQQATAKRLADGAASGHGLVATEHLPTQTVGDSQTLTVDGVTLQLLHWAPAHTDGDLAIYIPAEKVAFAGDLLTLDQPRQLIHTDLGGSSAGWLTSAQGLLGLDTWAIVPGHGRVQTAKTLTWRVNLIASERQRIEQLVAAGDTLAQVEAQVEDFPQVQFPPIPGRPVFPSFAEVVYGELTVRK
jgi:cyclase